LPEVSSMPPRGTLIARGITWRQGERNRWWKKGIPGDSRRKSEFTWKKKVIKFSTWEVVKKSSNGERDYGTGNFIP